jgi:ribosome biogenesis GTPase / thiamine phosphate phosphatase
MRGLVVKNTGSWYLVKTDDNQLVECKIKGTFRLKGIRSTNPVAVGDYVDVILNKEDAGLISNIEDRRNYIVRRSTNLSKLSHILAANVDQSFLIVTISKPETSTIFIDRCLASAEAYSVPSHLIFNKIDAYNEDDLRYLDSMCKLYTSIGYPCHKISAKTGEGVDEIHELLKDKVTLLSGNSGVGKSTLINSLIPSCHQKTADISTSHLRGMHTTTYSEMFNIDNKNGYIIDTPGVKGFGTFDFKDEEVGHYFPEIFKYSENCKFYNCTHTHEPNCAVRQAVEDHLISESRYTSYLSILEDKNENRYRPAY